MAAVHCSLLHATLACLILVVLPYTTSSQGDFDMNHLGRERSPKKDIMCYQCNSGLHADCSSIQANWTNNRYYLPCNNYKEYNGSKPFCRKIVQTIYDRDNLVRVIRKCGWERHPKNNCYQMTNDDHSEVVCQCFENGCNSAPRVGLAVTSLTAGLVLCFMLVS